MSKAVLFQTCQFSISMQFKTVLFQDIQFSISMQFSSIWSIDRTLSDATTPGKSGPGSDGNEGVLHIPHSSSITESSPSDCLVSYLGHSLVGSGWSYSSAEMQSVYSTASADWAKKIILNKIKNIFIKFNILFSLVFGQDTLHLCQVVNCLLNTWSWGP